MTKQECIQLGLKVGLSFVCKEYSSKWKQDIYVFQRQPDKRVYSFQVFNFLLEDMTEKNLILSVKSGYTRVV